MLKICWLAAASVMQWLVDREKESVASILWFDGEAEIDEEALLWVNNEHYAWR